MQEPVKYDLLDWRERRAVREAYVRDQNGQCWHCGEPLNEPAPRRIACLEIDRRLFPQSFFDYPIHLQHDHTTGLTEGAVHCLCNAVLWQYHGR